MLNKLHQEVSIAKASLIKIPPVLVHSPNCFHHVHHQFSPGTGHGPRRRTVERSSPLCVAPPDTSRHPKTTGWVPHTKAKRNLPLRNSLEGLSVLFKEMLWSSKTTLPLALGILLNQVKRVKRVKQALHLPLPLFANPVGSLADSYLSESLSRLSSTKKANDAKQGTCPSNDFAPTSCAKAPVMVSRRARVTPSLATRSCSMCGHLHPFVTSDPPIHYMILHSIHLLYTSYWRVSRHQTSMLMVRRV